MTTSSSKSKAGQGQGSVSLRADGRWMIRVTDRASGTRRTTYAASEAAARRKLRAMLARVEGGTSALDSAATVRAWSLDWIDTGRAARRRRDATVRAYGYRLRVYVVPVIGGIRLRDLTTLDVDDLAHDLTGRGLSAATVRGALVALSACLDDAVRGRLLASNPTTGVEVPERARRTRQVIPPTTEQVRDLIEAVDGTDLAPVVALLVTTGARIGEALAVRWDDLDLDAAVWEVRATTTTSATGKVVIGERTKSGDTRRVALGPSTVDALRAQRARVAALHLAAGPVWVEHDLVFPSAVGTPQHSANLRHRFRAAAARAGFPGSFHALRHYAATVGLSHLPASVVARQLGHRRAATTTDVYGHLIPSDSETFAGLVSGLVSSRQQ